MLTGWTHQVLQECRQFLGEGRELDEGCSQVVVVPADEVAAKLIQSLGVIVFILDMVCLKKGMGQWSV